MSRNASSRERTELAAASPASRAHGNNHERRRGMSDRGQGRRLAGTHLALGSALLALVFAMVVDRASAEPATTCVKATKVAPSRPAKAHYTGGYTDKQCSEPSATHEGKYEKLADLSAEQETKITALLEHVEVKEKGVDEKPTIQFSGVNVQVVNGEGKTATTNGEGNLVIGYDESDRAQTGSHNLIVGPYQQYTSFGGIVAGAFNAIEAEDASVLGGYNNDADGQRSVVSGGESNVAFGFASSVSGGRFSSAGGKWSSISGGEENQASGENSSIQGGSHNYAIGDYSAVDGGDDNSAEANQSTIDGGYENLTGWQWSSIFGGYKKKTDREYEAVL